MILVKQKKPRLLTQEMMNAIEHNLNSDDELTASRIRAKLAGDFPSISDVSLATIKRHRKELGWVSTSPHYCQLIREANKEKERYGVKYN